MTTHIILANSMRKKTAEKILLRTELRDVVRELRKRERTFVEHSLNQNFDPCDRERYEGIAAASRWAAEDIERALKLIPTHDKLERAKPQYPRYFRGDRHGVFVIESECLGRRCEWSPGGYYWTKENYTLDQLLRAMRDHHVEEISAETFANYKLPPIPE